MPVMKKHHQEQANHPKQRVEKGPIEHFRLEDHPIAIEVKNISKRYGTFESLKNVSFQVPLGKVCCLLGPNGSGKTTLLKILAGLISPTSGSAMIMGVDPQKDPSEARSHIGWMPAEERGGLYGRLTGRQNLKFFGSLQGVADKEMDRMIGNLGLQIGFQEEVDKIILKLSSGSKQKIGLARALLHDPAVLLLDEPIRNLDPQITLRFRRLLKDHLTRIQKKTVLLSTHLLEEARRVADMILILKNGEIVRTIEGLDLEKELKSSTLEEIYMKAMDAPQKS